MHTDRALIIIDVQDCFIYEGTFPEMKRLPVNIAELQKEYEHVLIAMMKRDDKPLSPLAFEPKPSAKKFTKETMSAATPELVAELESTGVEAADICGISTNSCVLATAFALSDLRFTVNVLDKRCASNYRTDCESRKAHDAAIYVMLSNHMTSSQWSSQSKLEL